MPIGEFIQEHFINPILLHSGYNPINTIAYAIIAIACAYAIYKLFRRINVDFDKDFIVRVVPYILLGSTIRVVTDSIDTGTMQKYDGPLRAVYEIIINSHMYDYGFATASPGIYVIIGLFATATLYYSYKTKNRNLGPGIALALFIFHLLILMPMFINIEYLALILLLASLTAYIYISVKKSSSVPMHWLILFSQSLDGFATFITLDVYNKIAGGSYVEQHVLANMLAGLFGGSMVGFVLIKIALSIAVIYMLEKDDNAPEKGFIAMLVIIFGMAPGVRNMLRLTVGA